MMKINANSMAHRRAAIPFAGLAILPVVVLFAATDAYGDLIFFRATRDQSVYAKNPSIYERVVFPPNSGLDLYVERKASLTLATNEIESVLVEKSQEDKALRKAVEEAARALGRERMQGEESVLYTVTFSIRAQAATKLRNFVNKHNREIFALKFGAQMLALPTLVGPFEGNDFAIVGLPDVTTNRLKEIFSPLKGKVIWK